MSRANTYTGLPWNGGGPWVLRADCPSGRHNTLAAARGRVYVERKMRGGVQCVCPRALALIDQENAGKRARRALPRSQRTNNGLARRPVASAVGQWVPLGVHVPDLSAGACRSPEGMRAFDLVITGQGNGNRGGVIQAKRFCAVCPIETWNACDQYVSIGEGDYPGIWRGVWAGKTAVERRAAHHAQG